MSGIIHLGVAGFGTVGSGLARILDKNGDWIESRIGKRIRIKSVLVRDLEKARPFDPGPDTVFTADPAVLLDDPDIPVVCELMGGITFAREFIRKALLAGKHVVTANKALLAEEGEELFRLAGDKGLGLYYEASIAGAIPIVQTLKESLAGNKVREILGILNGTANYILSEMTVAGLDFDTALAQAKELGYAEADPTLDIGGFDAAHKLALLVRLAFGRVYPYQELRIEGVSKVEPVDIAFAREFGYRIKLVGQAREVDGKLDAGVFPALVTYTFLLARVGGNYNAVRVDADAAGPIFLHGQGAGDLPTGSAVLADIMALVKDRSRPDNTGFVKEPLPRAEIMDPDLAETRHYFRFTVQDRTGVMAAISQCMADHGVSIAQVVQQEADGENNTPVVFMTHRAPYRAVRETIAEIDAMDFVTKPTVHYRIL